MKPKHSISVSLIRWLAFLIFMLNATSMYSQQNSVNASLDTSRLLIGDQTYYSIRLITARGTKVDWPVLRDSSVREMEVLRALAADTVKNEGDTIIRQARYLITSFDSGHHVIPEQRLVIYSASGSDTLTVPSVAFDVLSFPVDTTKDIFDIKAPYSAPVTFREILPYIGVLLGMAVLFFLVVYLIRRISKKKPIIPVRKPDIPAHVLALRQLDALKEEKLWQQGHVKEYYTRLTDIIRTYIEQRFSVPAMEQTSDEILRSLKGYLVDDDPTYAALSELLVLADLVKFAKALPLPNENESNILNAYLFVNHTMQESRSIADQEKVPAGNDNGKEGSHA